MCACSLPTPGILSGWISTSAHLQPKQCQLTRPLRDKADLKATLSTGLLACPHTSDLLLSTVRREPFLGTVWIPGESLQ